MYEPAFVGSEFSAVQTKDVEIIHPTLATLNYQAGGVETLKIPKNLPIKSLGLAIEGTLTVSGGTATVNGNNAGVLDLISGVKLHLAGEDRIAGNSARSLGILQAYRNRRRPTYTGPATSSSLAAGTYAFRTSLNIQFDVGDYTSILDAYAYDDAVLTLNYGQGNRFAVANGNAEIAITAQIKLQPQMIAGFPDGVKGGREKVGGLRYFDRFYDTTSFRLQSSGETYFDVPEDRMYDALIFEVLDINGARKTGLVKDMEYSRLNARPFKMTVAEMDDWAQENQDLAYSESSAIIVPPFFQGRHSETMLVTTGRKRCKFTFTCNDTPAEGDQIRVHMGYFVGGPEGVGRFRKLPGE